MLEKGNISLPFSPFLLTLNCHCRSSSSQFTILSPAIFSENDPWKRGLLNLFEEINLVFFLGENPQAHKTYSCNEKRKKKKTLQVIMSSVFDRYKLAVHNSHLGCGIRWCWNFRWLFIKCWVMELISVLVPVAACIALWPSSYRGIREAYSTVAG